MAIKRISEGISDLACCLQEYRRLEQQLYELESTYPDFRYWYKQQFNQNPLFNLNIQNKEQVVKKKEKTIDDEKKEIRKQIEFLRNINTDSTEKKEAQETIEELQKRLSELEVKKESLSHGFVKILRKGGC